MTEPVHPNSKQFLWASLFILVVSAAYLYAFPQLARMARGAIMDGLNTTILRECSIPLPEISEQQRIAARLAKADRLCQTRRYALELTDNFLDAVFRQLFGSRLRAGPFRMFGELVKITGGGTPAREHPEFYKGRIPWLTSKDMKGDYI